MNMELSAPWHEYHNKLMALFAEDNEVSVSPDLKEIAKGVYEITISSANSDKLYAIEKLIGNGRVFGNNFVTIKYLCENQINLDVEEYWERAFGTNPLFVKMVKVKTPIADSPVSYAVFTRDIISFFDDDVSDYCGNYHGIVADVVKDVVNTAYVLPCTESEE